MARRKPVTVKAFRKMLEDTLWRLDPHKTPLMAVKKRKKRRASTSTEQQK
jgi:hypothetical protein